MRPTELIDLLVKAQMLVDESAGVFEWKPTIKKTEAFAKLVAAKEREACAMVCEIGINNATDWDSSDWDQACENRAYHIRARGEQA